MDKCQRPGGLGERPASRSGQPRAVRPEIASSWRRCAALGARPDVLRPTYDAAIDPDGALLRAARPVLDRLIQRVRGEGVAVLLGDHRARIIERHVDDAHLRRQLDRVQAIRGFVFDEATAGTNGLGTALEEDRPVRVRGEEHFVSQLASFAGTAAPIHHPFSGRRLGVLCVFGALACADDRMLGLVTRTAADVEGRLGDEASRGQRALLTQFLRTSHGTRDAVMARDASLVLMNAAAARLLTREDHALLADRAAEVGACGLATEARMTLADERTWRVRCHRADTGHGAVVVLRRLDEERAGASPGPPAGLRGLVGPSHGWRSAQARARDAWTSGSPVLLRGEAGTGKLALARALADLVPLPVVESEVAGLSDLHRPGVVVLRHVQQVRDWYALEGPLARALRGGCRLLASWTDPSEEPPAAVSVLDRLGVVQVVVPPLRDRREDIPALATAFLHERDPHARLSFEVLQLLQRLPLPGNVAELRLVIRSLGIRSAGGPAAGRPVSLDDVPEELRTQTTRRPLSRYQEAELQALLRALHDTGGNRKRAAVAARRLPVDAVPQDAGVGDRPRADRLTGEAQETVRVSLMWPPTSCNVWRERSMTPPSHMKPWIMSS